MSEWTDFYGAATPSQTYDQWYADQVAAANRNGGDAGTVIRPEDYSSSISYTLPGQQGNWTWDSAANQFEQPNGGKWNTDGKTDVNVIHDNGTGNQDGQGVYTGNVQFDNTPGGWEKVVDDVMPWAVGAITALAGGAAIGGAMGAGEGGAAAAGASDAGADGLTTGIGEGASGEAAAPTFTYGNTAPAWSQAGGTELGSGLYGTDAGSMADLYGTTAGGSTGEIGSALGTGVAADAAAPMALAGAADAGGAGLGLSDLYKLYQQGSSAVKLGSAISGLLNPQTPTPTASGGLSQFLSGGSGSSGGSGIGAGGIAAAVKGALGEAPVTDLTSPIQLIQPAQPVLQGGNFSSGNNNAGDKLGGYAAWHAQHG